MTAAAGDPTGAPAGGATDESVPAVPGGSVWLTYDGMAEALGISPASAKRRAMKRRWPRRAGNGGRALVAVPPDVLAERCAASATGAAARGATGDDTHDAARDATGDAPPTARGGARGTTGGVTASAITPGDVRAAVAEAEVRRLEATVAALSAHVDDLRRDRDRLEAELHRTTSRGAGALLARLRAALRGG